MSDVTALADGLRISDADSGLVWPLLALPMPDGSMVFVSSGRSGIRSWDAQRGVLLGEWEDPGDVVNDFAAARLPGGGAVVAAATYKGVCRWDAASGRRLPGDRGSDRDGIWSVAAFRRADGRVIVAGGGDDGVVYRWDGVTGELVGPALVGHRTCIKSVAAVELAGGRVFIVSADEDGTFRTWDDRLDRQARPPAAGHARMIRELGVASLADGRVLLASADVGGTVCRWELAYGGDIGRPIETHASCIALALSVTPHGPELLIAGEDQKVRRWNALTGERLDWSLVGCSVSVACRADGAAVVGVGARDGSITIRELVPAAPQRSAWEAEAAKVQLALFDM